MVRLTIQDVSTLHTRTEAHTIGNADPNEWAKRTESEYNAWAESEGRNKLTVTHVEVIREADPHAHTWRKLRMVSDSIDTPYICDVCGVTGKRMGLSSHIVIDPKYRRVAYLKCHAATGNP